MKHPFQHVQLNKNGDYFFAAAINSVFVFKFVGNHAKLVGSWTDEVDPYYTIRKHHRELLEQYEQQQREKAEKERTERKDEEPDEKLDEDLEIPEEHLPASKRQKFNRKPKLPLPGPGAPPTYTYIRDSRLSRDNKHLIVTTDNDKAVVVFKINYNNEKNVLEFIKRQPFPKRPSAVSTSLDDANVIISDKFGDVYSISMTDPAVIEDDKDLIPILGHVSMLTGVENARDENGKEVVLTADRDEHIRVSYYPKSYVVKKWLFGHEEFVSNFVLPDWCHGKVLVSAGGDSFICTWLWQNQEELTELKSKIDVSQLAEKYLNEKHLTPEKFQNETGTLKEYCVSKIVPLNELRQIVIIFERINAFFVFDLSEDGEMKFFKEYSVKYDIISATSSNDKLILSLDNLEDSLEIFKIEKGKDLVKLEGSENLIRDINQANDAIIGEAEEIIPLFTTNQLRKRREH